MSSRRKSKASQMLWRKKSLSSSSSEEEKQQLKKERHNNVEKRSRMKFNNLLQEMKNILLEAGANMQKDTTTAMIIGKFTEHLEKLDAIKQKLMIKVKTKRAELEAKGQCYQRSCCLSGNLCFNGIDSSTEAYNNTTEIFTSFEETQPQQCNGPTMDDFKQPYVQKNNLVQSSTDSEGLFSVAALETLRALVSNYDEEQLSQILFQQLLSSNSSYGNSSVMDRTLQHTESLNSLDPVSVDLNLDSDSAARFSLAEDFDEQFQRGQFDELLNWNF